MISDSDFFCIENLNYLPWIGNHYDGKLLVMGESHYGEDNPKRINEVNMPQFTRVCAQEMGVEGFTWGKVKFYKNLWRIGQKYKLDMTTNDFWNKVVYCNLVQKAMLDSKSRPTLNDFENGANVFCKILLKLKPKACLMAGLSSLNYVYRFSSENDFKVIENITFGNVGRSKPRYLKLEHESGYTVDLIFIQHPSKYFSYNAWGNFLLNQFPNLL